MLKVLAAALVLGLASNAAWAQDKKKGKPEDPQAALLKAIDKKLEAFRAELLRDIERLIDARLGKAKATVDEKKKPGPPAFVQKKKKKAGKDRKKDEGE